MPSATDALSDLQAGNVRFVQGRPQRPRQDAGRRAELTAGQAPFALVLACSDSRVAPEVVFDQGLGDLFVVRTAGQVVDTGVLGSIEYGVAALGVPLVVVLGHESCGAVRATLDVLAGQPMPEGYIRDVVDLVTPSALAAREKGETAMDEVVAEHARRTAGSLVERSAVLGSRVGEGRCTVVSMQYRLSDGRVDLLSRSGLSTAIRRCGRAAG